MADETKTKKRIVKVELLELGCIETKNMRRQVQRKYQGTCKLPDDFDAVSIKLQPFHMCKTYSSESNKYVPVAVLESFSDPKVMELLNIEFDTTELCKRYTEMEDERKAKEKAEEKVRLAEKYDNDPVHLFVKAYTEFKITTKKETYVNQDFFGHVAVSAEVKQTYKKNERTWRVHYSEGKFILNDDSSYKVIKRSKHMSKVWEAYTECVNGFRSKIDRVIDEKKAAKHTTQLLTEELGVKIEHSEERKFAGRGSHHYSYTVDHYRITTRKDARYDFNDDYITVSRKGENKIQITKWHVEDLTTDQVKRIIAILKEGN